jgi:hypothetical protein
MRGLTGSACLEVLPIQAHGKNGCSQFLLSKLTFGTTGRRLSPFKYLLNETDT